MAKTASVVTNEQLLALIQKLQAENTALKAGRAAPQPKGVDVKENGQIAFSIASGNGTVPVAYYGWQWEQIIAQIGEVQKVLKAGKGASGNRVISQTEFRNRKAAK